MIGDWQSRNYEGIESPLGYTIRRGKWTDRPVWTQYTTWWVEVSVVAGFNVDHPFLWYLLLWMPDPNNVSTKNVFILSGSVTGVSFVTNIPVGSLTIGCESFSGSVYLSNVSSISVGGLALGFAMTYNDATSYIVDVSGNLVDSEVDACELGMFSDGNQNTYGLCSGVDIYELSLSHPLFTFSDVAFCDTNNNVYYCIGG